MSDFTVVDSEENHKLRNELQIKTLELARAKELLKAVDGSVSVGVKLKIDIHAFLNESK